jgi:hypothetical protein
MLGKTSSGGMFSPSVRASLAIFWRRNEQEGTGVTVRTEERLDASRFMEPVGENGGSWDGDEGIPWSRRTRERDPGDAGGARDRETLCVGRSVAGESISMVGTVPRTAPSFLVDLIRRVRCS